MAIFNWGKSKAQQDSENPVMVGRRQSMVHDVTENIKVNGEMTRGILDNSYPGYKLAAGLAHAPIHTPVSIMGWPIPVAPTEQGQKILDEWIESHYMLADKIHVSSHGDGTIWAWPYYNASTGRADVELILDDYVTDIVKDLASGEVVGIYVTETIMVQNGYNQTDTVERIRHFTRDEIRDTIGGRVTIYRNPLGIMPICFPNDPAIGSIRGRSDLARIIPDLKIYHDIKLKWASNLTKMNPKFVQEVQASGGVKAWMTNQGFTSIDQIDGASIDVVFNLKDQEKSDFLGIPNGMGNEYAQLLQMIYWMIVQAQDVPELAWGLLSQGNHASAEEQMERLMGFCRKKQRQHTSRWGQLFSAILAIESKLRILPTSKPVGVEWNRLDGLSESTKAEIFTKISSAVKSMVEAGVPGEIIHAKLRDFYPDSTVEKYEEWRKQRQDAAKYKQFLGASYLDALEAEGQAE